MQELCAESNLLWKWVLWLPNKLLSTVSLCGREGDAMIVYPNNQVAMHFHCTFELRPGIVRLTNCFDEFACTQFRITKNNRWQ